MKAGFFDPYLDTLGGGEKYTLTLAEYLSTKGWIVDIFWNESELKEKLELRLNLNLQRVNFVPIPKNVLERLKMTRNYDLFFWVSDGSIPLLFSKNNILHFQVPFHQVDGRSLWNQVKLKKIDIAISNSGFTKKFVDKEYGIDSKIIFPPVDIDSFKPGEKENIILTVGRFSQLLQAKRQDVLVETFKRMTDQGLSGWKLILAGGTDIGGEDYVRKLKSAAKPYPIEFFDNCSFEVLKSLYERAKLFWYAGGYGIDKLREPEKVEHFGITTVEAMAAGCVPLVVGRGGLKEILENGVTGYFWKRKEDLATITLDLIKNERKIKSLSSNVIKSSQQFSKAIFNKKFDEIINQKEK